MTGDIKPPKTNRIRKPSRAPATHIYLVIYVDNSVSRMGSSAGSYTAAESHSSSCMYSNVADNNKATGDGVVSKRGFLLQSHFGAVHTNSRFFC